MLSCGRHKGKKHIGLYILLYIDMHFSPSNVNIFKSNFKSKFFCAIPDLMCQALLEYNIPLFFNYSIQLF